MGLRSALASIAGGRQEILATAPSDELRYAAMGGVILSTALVACVSATLAVHIALRMPVPWAIIVGLGWGLIIYNLDRLLVVQMVRQENKWMTVGIAVPRLLLAIILGAVISTPMVLQIFQPEINNQLDIMHAADITAYDKSLSSNPDYASITTLQKNITAAQQTVDTGVTIDVDSVPAVISAEKEYRADLKTFQKAENNVVCEKEGSCGSHKVGAGIAYDEKVQIRDHAQAVLNGATDRLNAARTRARKDLQTSQTAAVAAAKAYLETTIPRLNDLQKRFDADKAEHAALTSKNSGLLARLEALGQLSSGHFALRTAHWALFALFLAIELLPVIMKLLQVVGPETAYERALKIAEADAENTVQLRVDNQRQIEIERLQRARRLESYQGQKASEKAMANIDLVVETQSEVMGDVLASWRQYAVEQSAQDLQKWRKRHPSTVVRPADPVRTQPHSPTVPLAQDPVQVEPDPAQPDVDRSPTADAVPEAEPQPLAEPARIVPQLLPPRRPAPNPVPIQERVPPPVEFIDLTGPVPTGDGRTEVFDQEAYQDDDRTTVMPAPEAENYADSNGFRPKAKGSGRHRDESGG